MTKEFLPQMQKEFPPLKDSGLQKYVSQLGEEVVVANGLEANPYYYEFGVVETKMVNAFALPAGTVFVTAPLIAMAETEAELAGVVGHEVGHVQARHTAERIDRMERQRTRNLLTTLGSAILGAGAGFGLAQLICPPRDRECVAKVSAAGAGVGAGASLMIQQFAFMAHSREDEMEADRIGFRTSVQAGFDRKRVGDFYEKLYEMERARNQQRLPILSTMADAMSTHPPSRERVQQMKKLAAEEPSSNGRVSSREFENAKDRATEIMKKKA